MSTGIWIAIVAIVAWAAIVLFGMHQASRRREFAHRERLAMIERGLVPAPDKDPEQFERIMQWQGGRASEDRALRARKAGVLMIFIGVGVAMMIGVTADEPRIAIGVGGLIALIGAGFFITATMDASTRSQRDDLTRPSPPPPPEPQ